MVNCSNCGQKIGFFQQKFNYETGKRSSIFYCKKCNDEFEKERFLANKKKAESEKKVYKNNKDKQEIIKYCETYLSNQKKQQDKQEIIKYCEKYLSNKDFYLKGNIIGIYRNKELFNLISKEDLDFLMDHFVKIYRQSQDMDLNDSYDYDDQIETETMCDNIASFIKDFEKLKKLIISKGINTNYIEMFEILAELADKDIKKTIEKLTLPAYNKISRITKTDKKIIVKEYMKLGFDDPTDLIISDLFDKFGLKYTDDEVDGLLQECFEERDLDDFEKDLGKGSIKKLLGFENLNGAQFEEYLKDLFINLGYKVIKTKLSGDQGADLVLKKDDLKTVVQAKKYTGTVSNKAVQEVVASKKFYGADETMVVTTGNFTKSAMALAKSNGVILWDKTKLNSIIKEINGKSQSDKKTISQETKINGDLLPSFCPFCEEEIQLKVLDLPEKGKSKELSCPKCTVDISVTIPDEYYVCGGCKKSFKKISERISHEKNCSILKKRQVICKDCKKQFTLDDSEFKELNSERTLTFDCPLCGAKNNIKK